MRFPSRGLLPVNAPRIVSSVLVARCNRHRVMVLVFFLASFSQMARSDVYQDRTLSEQEAFGLSRLLTGAVVPGGVRELVINGNTMTVSRHVIPGRSKGSSVLDQVQSGYEAGAEAGGLLPEQYDALDRLMIDEAPAETITSEADRLVAVERQRIVHELESPFRYRAGIWDIYARVPVSAIKPDSSLTGLPPEAGFIYMAETTSEPSQGYWEIRFGKDFILGNIMSEHAGDAPGFDPPLRRFPGTRRTLTYEERANNWTSVSWSFQGRGVVKEQLEHYVGQYETMGYVRKAIGVFEVDEALVQLARGSDQVVVYVVDTGTSSQPLQVTIQQSEYR